MLGVRKACRELAEWCHETQQENDRLKAENAKLRELLAGDETQRRIAAIGEGTVPTYHGTETVDEARIVVENAKLRELVRGLVYATHPADRARLIADAVELGVEVSDD